MFFRQRGLDERALPQLEPRRPQGAAERQLVRQSESELGSSGREGLLDLIKEGEIPLLYFVVTVTLSNRQASYRLRVVETQALNKFRYQNTYSPWQAALIGELDRVLLTQY